MFSEIIDEVVSRSGRPEKQADIISYANQVIRECRALQFFDKDLEEDVLTVDVIPYIWTRPRLLRKLGAAKYTSSEIFPTYITPSRKQLDTKNYFYGSGNSYVFTGENLFVGEEIGVAYYVRPITYKYYEEAARPAVFNEETGVWTYLTATTDEEKAAAEALVTDWLMLDWKTLVVEGTLAKIYGVVGDQRSIVTYSGYMNQQKVMRVEEVSSVDDAAQGS